MLRRSPAAKVAMPRTVVKQGLEREQPAWTDDDIARFLAISDAHRAALERLRHVEARREDRTTVSRRLHPRRRRRSMRRTLIQGASAAHASAQPSRRSPSLQNSSDPSPTSPTSSGMVADRWSSSGSVRRYESGTSRSDVDLTVIAMGAGHGLEGGAPETVVQFAGVATWSGVVGNMTCEWTYRDNPQAQRC
jgi:hypothetical protein